MCRLSNDYSPGGDSYSVSTFMFFLAFPLSPVLAINSFYGSKFPIPRFSASLYKLVRYQRANKKEGHLTETMIIAQRRILVVTGLVSKSKKKQETNEKI